MMNLLSFWAQSLPFLLRGLLISVEVTAASLAIGLPLGLVLALAVRSKSAALNYTSLAIVEIGRGAPALILLQFAYYGLPVAGLTLTSFAASVVALGWNAGSYISEIMRAGLEAVPRGEVEAASAMGMTFGDTLRFVLVPQGLRVAAPALLGFSATLLQATSLCFAIALPELTSNAYMIGASSFRYMEILCLAGILYAAICIPATIAVGGLERHLGKHAQGSN